MSTPESLAAQIALAAFRNTSASTVSQLQQAGIDPEGFFEADAGILAQICGGRPESFSMSARQDILHKAQSEAEFIDRQGIKVLFCTDPDYPYRLQGLPDAPAILYVRGSADLSPRHALAMVGTRHATRPGTEITRELVAGLRMHVDSATVFSGLAYGIDVAAHRACLAEGLPTVAVMAQGLDTIYPADHRDTARRIVDNGGAIITEYPTFVYTTRGSFLSRNRIVAGLSDITVVVESNLEGGSMHTANNALEYGRITGAVPGRPHDTYSHGPNSLIRDAGAQMICTAADIVTAAGWEPLTPEGTQTHMSFDMPPESRNILDYIADNPEATVNDICTTLTIPFAHLTTILFKLEMDGFVAAVPGGKYIVKGYC